MPEAETGHLRPPGGLPRARRLGGLRDGALYLIQEHPVAAGLVSGVALLLFGFLLFAFPRPLTDPLRQADKLLRQSAARQQAALAQVRAGEQAIGQRDYAQAYAALSRAVELGADSSRLRFLKGLSALELNLHREAVRDLSLALGQEAVQPTILVLRGKALKGLGQYQAALRDFQQAGQLFPPHSPGFAEVHYAIAQVNERLGNLPQALEALERALQAGRQEAEIYLLRGQLQEQLGQAEAALADYSRALAVNANLAAAHLRRGILQVRLGRYEPAVADLSRALALGLTDREAYSYRGVAYAHLGQTGAARQDLETAVRLGAFEARPALKAVENLARRKSTPAWESFGPSARNATTRSRARSPRRP